MRVVRPSCADGVPGTSQLGPGPALAAVGSLGKALAEVQGRPMTISLVLGFGVGLAGPLLAYWAVTSGLPTRDNAVVWLWLAAVVSVASLFAGTAVAAFLPSLLLAPTDRAASAVHAWIGASEVRRMFGSATAAMGIPTTPEEAELWLAAQPDVPRLGPLRFETLLLTRRFDEARTAARHSPATHPSTITAARNALPWSTTSKTAAPI